MTWLKMAMSESGESDIRGIYIEEGLTELEYIQKLQQEIVTARLDRDAWIREWQKERILADVLRDALLHACGAPGGLILEGPPFDAIKQYDLVRK
jgi:hypothetical protein